MRRRKDSPSAYNARISSGVISFSSSVSKKYRPPQEGWSGSCLARPHAAARNKMAGILTLAAAFRCAGMDLSQGRGKAASRPRAQTRYASRSHLRSLPLDAARRFIPSCPCAQPSPNIRPWNCAGCPPFSYTPYTRLYCSRPARCTLRDGCPQKASSTRICGFPMSSSSSRYPAAAHQTAPSQNVPFHCVLP